MLGRCLRDERERRPFSVEAIVLLPDHLHAVWILPRGDGDFSTRWGAVRARFTREWLASGGGERPVQPGQAQEGRRGIWQPRFFEHTIRDEDDLGHHIDYIRFNPVKRGLTACGRDWPWSPFHRFVDRGAYPPEWGCSESPPPPGTAKVDAHLVE